MTKKRSNEISSKFRPEKKRQLKSTFSNPKLIKKELDQSTFSTSPPPPQFSQLFCDSFEFVNDVDSNRSRIRKVRSSNIRIKEEEDEIQNVKDESHEEYLPKVPDHVKEGMDVLMIGSNPGRMSSKKCQHFGHPSNHFYKALHRSGFTSSLINPKDDFTMLKQSKPFLAIGLTNLASRPTRMAQEVQKDENEEGAIILTDLIRKHKPRIGVFVGIGVAKAFEQAIMKKKEFNVKNEVKKETESDSDEIYIDIPDEVPLVTDSELGLGVGLLPIGIRHEGLEDRPPFTLLFASPSTSGRVTSHQLPQKADCMKRAKILAESTFTFNPDSHNLILTSSKRVCIRLI